MLLQNSDSTNSIWLKVIHSDSTWWWQPSWILPSWTKKLQLIHWQQLDDGSDSYWILIQSDSKTHPSIWLTQTWLTRWWQPSWTSAILDSAILHKTLNQTNSIWLKLIHSDSTWWWQPSWILPSWIQPLCTKKISLIHSHSSWWWHPSWILPSSILTFWTKKFHLIQSHSTWWLTTILNSAILHSVILHKTLTPTNSISLKLIHSHWTLMMAAILNSAILNSAIWIRHLLKLWFQLIQSDSNLIHSDSSWWWQPSWIQPFCAQRNLHSLILTQLWWWQPYWILPSSIHPFWTKKFHLFILTQLDDGRHLEFCHLGFSHFGFIHNSFSSETHSTCQYQSHHLHKKNSFILLTQLDDGSHLELLPCWNQTLPSWIQTPCYLLSDSPQKHSHFTLTLTQTNSIWLKLIHSHLTWMMAAILNSAILNLAILDSAILVFSLKLHSHLPRLVPIICTKNFTHSFWLNLTIAAILKSAILDSAILYKKTSFIHSHSPWWWQPYCILPSWIQPFTQKKLHSYILTKIDDGSHLEFGHVGFRHLVFFSENHSRTLSLHSESDSN